jgi:hypothetical protein
MGTAEGSQEAARKDQKHVVLSSIVGETDGVSVYVSQLKIRGYLPDGGVLRQWVSPV